MSEAGVYFHGLPGGPAELDALGPGSPLTAIDRMGVAGDDYPARLEAVADRLQAGAPYRIVAFSLGAMSALRLAAAHPDLVRELVLIGPAGPLQLGDFLSDMAGRPVFEAAQRGGFPFKGFVYGQASAIRMMPQSFLESLFRGAPVHDKALLVDPDIMDGLIAAWRSALLSARAAYRDELAAYVEDWSDVPGRVTVPVTIHMGAADSWVPPAMVKALAKSLGTEPEMIEHPGLGHYGTASKVLLDIR
ncbi:MULTISPECIES: alpha/beta fold hydrolase [Maritimibacter]|uniref:alpha/beta fold hydrolase n=1 Tax=Maritimibacter TaxID=404235 RepID=UPI001108CD05|nr:MULTISPECIES: alpha/beta hydrolase [Maritimibacter]MBL6427422.1 alpha/beta hydrolase [Maritimibacter sp.]